MMKIAYRIGIVVALASLGGCVDLCEKPLADFCATSPCKAFNERLAELRAASQSFCFYAVTGSCGGGFRFIESGGGFGGSTEYYDAGGALVALSVNTDTNAYCGGSSFSQVYGPIPSCSKAVTENLCQTARADLGATD